MENTNGTTANRRARKGGEIGLNGEIYVGGTFMPSTRMPKQGKPTSGISGRVLVAPGVLEHSNGRRAIYSGIRAVTVMSQAGTLAPLPANHAFWQADPAYYVEVEALCVRFNAGQRWL